MLEHLVRATFVGLMLLIVTTKPVLLHFLCVYFALGIISITLSRNMLTWYIRVRTHSFLSSLANLFLWPIAWYAYLVNPEQAKIDIEDVETLNLYEIYQAELAYLAVMAETDSSPCHEEQSNEINTKLTRALNNPRAIKATQFTLEQ